MWCLSTDSCCLFSIEFNALENKKKPFPFTAIPRSMSIEYEIPSIHRTPTSRLRTGMRASLLCREAMHLFYKNSKKFNFPNGQRTVISRYADIRHYIFFIVNSISERFNMIQRGQVMFIFLTKSKTIFFNVEAIELIESLRLNWAKKILLDSNAMLDWIDRAAAKLITLHGKVQLVYNYFST